MAASGALAQKRCPASPDKIQYESYQRAREVGDRREAAGETTLYVYNCSDCGTYHLSKKRGDEAKMIDPVAGGVKTYSTETPRKPQPMRDERFVVPINPNADKVADYLRTTSPNERITLTKVMKRTNLSRDIAKRAMIALGWESHGTGRGAYWLNDGREKPGGVVPSPANSQTSIERRGKNAPTTKVTVSVDVDTVDVDIAKVKDLTVFQLQRAYEAIGLRLTLTVDNPSKG